MVNHALSSLGSFLEMATMISTATAMKAVLVILTCATQAVSALGSALERAACLACPESAATR